MKQKKCVIIDYGFGNIFSVMRAIEKIGHIPEIASAPDKIVSADRVILPGVGAFGQASQRLKQLNLDEAIHEFVISGRPFLGVCVGMQLLTDQGEEFGLNNGLGIIPGSVKKINIYEEFGVVRRVPLLGWFPVEPVHPHSLENKFMNSYPDQNSFYFTHSYQVKVTNIKHKIASHQFGSEKITSIIQKDNVIGVQFHPERSAENGQIFLKNFIEKR